MIGLTSGATDTNSNLQPLRHFSTFSQWSALQNMKEYSLTITPLLYFFVIHGNVYIKNSPIYILYDEINIENIYIIIYICLQHDGRC